MNQLDIFGSDIYEYLFVIEPDHETSGRVISMRNNLNRLISLPEEVLHSKPHISLCYFEARDFSDQFIRTKTKQVLSSLQPFDVQIIGSEIWKNGTFILKVNPNEHTLELQKQLSLAFKGVIKNLHLTIARSMPVEMISTIPMELFDYQGRFPCKSIYILKKKHPDPYQLLETIQLG